MKAIVLILLAVAASARRDLKQMAPVSESLEEIAMAPGSEDMNALREELCASYPGPAGMLTIGDEASNGTVNALIEIPSGTKVKYEIDKDTGLIGVDRILYNAVAYPINYGFIPRTGQDDGDNLDIMVVSQSSFVPLSVARVKLLGVMLMTDTGEKDDKLIGVAADDPMFADMETLDDLGQQRLDEIQRFFEVYKRGEEGKEVTVDGFEGIDTARSKLQESIDLYNSLCGSEN